MVARSEDYRSMVYGREGGKLLGDPLPLEKTKGSGIGWNDYFFESGNPSNYVVTLKIAEKSQTKYPHGTLRGEG